MEANHMNQSNDMEPNAKRPKLETASSAAISIPEAKDPFLSLPPDVLTKIIANIPVVQWPALELLDNNFRACTLSAWRQLRNVNVEREFLIKPDKIVASVESIIQKLADCSPFLTSLSGIEIRLGNGDMNAVAVDSLAQFEHLQSISMGDAKLFDGRRGLPLDAVAAFLESTRSRTSLKELHLCNIVQRQANRPIILDQFATSFVNGREIHSPLLLEKFSFSATDPLYIRLDTLDTSRLTELRLGRAYIEPGQLASLIERSSILRQIELSFLCCPGWCNGPRLQANKNVLTALASREQLTAIKFGCVASVAGDRCTDWECMNFHHEFIEMLQTIGRRGRLRQLSIGRNFVSERLGIDICATIPAYIPYLRSVKFDHNIRPENMNNIVGLVELEEIHFASNLMGSAIEKLVQLPQLKRLAFSYMDNQALKRLADVTTLMDLRIRDVQKITADVFDEWSDGLASNFQTLMLGGIWTEREQTNAGLARLLEKAVQLRVLILHGNIDDRTLTAIAKSCPKLEILGVQSPWLKITVYQMQEIVDRCPKLKKFCGIEVEIRSKLRLSKYRKISYVGMDMDFWKYDFDDSQFD